MKSPRLMLSLWLAFVAFTAVVHAEVAKEPKLVIKTMDGKSFDLAAHRGHFVIVNFWATWCAPCIKELPDLSAFVAAHKDVDAIGIAWEDTEKAEIAAFVKKHPVVYPLAQGDVYNPPADFGAPLSLPTTYLIAPDGSVAKVFNGPIDTSDLDKAIAQAAPAAAATAKKN